VKGQGHTVTKTDTVAPYMLASVYTMLLPPPWDWTSYDCLVLTA